MGIGLQSSNFNKKWFRNIICSLCVNIEMNHTDQKSKSFKDNDCVTIYTSYRYRVECRYPSYWYKVECHYPSYRYKVECCTWLINQQKSSSLILRPMYQTFCPAKESDTEWEKLFYQLLVFSVPVSPLT